MPLMPLSLNAFLCGSTLTLITYAIYKGDLKDNRVGLYAAAGFCGYVILNHIIQNIGRPSQQQQYS